MWTRIDRPFSIPLEVRKVLQTLSQAGFEAYIVGGAVRDFIRGNGVKDFDIATNAEPDVVISLFEKVIEVGRAFGVLKVVTETGREVEVATFRKEEQYKDHRHPSKVEFSNIESDSDRRDFTINGLYYDIKTNQIFDRHGGLEDLKLKRLRTIGDPLQRFNEDALRLLRAVRFSSRFSFSIEEKTFEAMKAAAGLIRKVSMERIRDELLLILKGASPKQAWKELDEAGILGNIMPEIAVAVLSQRKVWEQTLRALSVLSKIDREEPDAFYWAMVMLPTFRVQPIDAREEEARRFSKRMKLSNETADLVSYLVRETPKFRDSFSMRDATLLKWMKDPRFDLLVRFHYCDAISFDGNLGGYEFVRSLHRDFQGRLQMKPLVTGEDLVRLGMEPGRHYSEILRTIEDLTLEGKISTHEEAMDFVLQNFVK